MAFTLPYTHPSRHVPFGGSTGLADIVYGLFDYSGAAFVMTFAPTEGGTALITLTNQPAGTQGISATYDAGYVHPNTGEVIGATTITPFIAEAALEGLSYPSDPSSPLVLYYDLLVTPSGELQRMLCKGTLSIQQGVGD